MNIDRVVRDLVMTQRLPTLAHKSLRVVEDHRGGLQVAIDAVGARPGDFVITMSSSAAAYALDDPRITTDLTITGIIDYWSEERWYD